RASWWRACQARPPSIPWRRVLANRQGTAWGNRPWAHSSPKPKPRAACGPASRSSGAVYRLGCAASWGRKQPDLTARNGARRPEVGSYFLRVTATEIPMSFRITGLSPDPFRPLFGLPDEELARHGARRYRADAKPGYPDRVELRDAEPGETLLLVNY